MCKIQKCSADSGIAELQTSSAINISAKVVHWDFHDQTARCKLSITKYNANGQIKYCKANLHWTLEQWKGVTDDAPLTGSLMRE